MRHEMQLTEQEEKFSKRFASYITWRPLRSDSIVIQQGIKTQLQQIAEHVVQPRKS